MKNFVFRLFQATEFDFVLALLALVVFCWPILALENLANPRFIVAYYFCTWGGFILLQMVSAYIRNQDPKSGTGRLNPP